MTVAIIDYGAGNLRSAAKAFEREIAELGSGNEVARITTVPRASVERLADRLGSAGEDDPLRRERGERGRVDVVGADLGIDARLAHPAGDELGVLGPKVQNQNGFARQLGHKP